MIISILIFILLIICFYLIISNFGINNNFKNINSPDSSDSLENKINYLKYEINNLKNISNQSTMSLFTNDNSVNSSNQSNRANIQTDTKEIIFETEPIKEININQAQQQQQQQQSCNKPPPIIYDPIANYDIAKLSDPLVDPRGRTSADQIPTPQVAAQFNFPTQGVLDRYHRIGLLVAINKDSNNKTIGSEFVWNGRSKTRKHKKNTNSNFENNSTNSDKLYKGVQIKEGFDSDFDSDSDSDLDFDDNLSSDSTESFKNSVTNVYNVYSNSNDNNILELIGKKVTDNWYKYFTSITMGNKIIKVNVHNRNRRELYSGDIVYIPEIKKTYKVKIDPMDMIEYNPYFF